MLNGIIIGVNRIASLAASYDNIENCLVLFSNASNIFFNLIQYNKINIQIIKLELQSNVLKDTKICQHIHTHTYIYIYIYIYIYTQYAKTYIKHYFRVIRILFGNKSIYKTLNV